MIAGWQVAKNFTVPVLVGGSQDALQRDYRINGTPSTYLLGEKGQILLHTEGYKPGDEKVLEDKIEAALNSNVSVATPSQTCPPSAQDIHAEPVRAMAAIPPMVFNQF